MAYPHFLGACSTALLTLFPRTKTRFRRPPHLIPPYTNEVPPPSSPYSPVHKRGSAALLTLFPRTQTRFHRPPHLIPPYKNEVPPPPYLIPPYTNEVPPPQSWNPWVSELGPECRESQSTTNSSSSSRTYRGHHAPTPPWLCNHRTLQPGHHVEGE
uniref:Uncharacterized protein n=1 Tax=Timema tahoe TaxID=61484 RepID=A0A7R9P1N3_9NEOP|nr:unnamed protein product [Timema tahoe]